MEQISEQCSAVQGVKHCAVQTRGVEERQRGVEWSVGAKSKLKEKRRGVFVAVK